MGIFRQLSDDPSGAGTTMVVKCARLKKPWSVCFSARQSETKCRVNAMTRRLSAGVVHSVPADLRKTLVSDPAAWKQWEDITPLARNEWICWVISVKKPETRRQHVERVCTELKEGMRRPCCWPGCPHR